MDVQASEEVCFELGIKFGSLYHQFAGTPVSPSSGPALATAMEASIENQPLCESVTVSIDTEAVAADSVRGYTELTGRYLEVEIVVQNEQMRAVGEMSMQDGYPEMRIRYVEPV